MKRIVRSANAVNLETAIKKRNRVLEIVAGAEKRRIRNQRNLAEGGLIYGLVYNTNNCFES